MARPQDDPTARLGDEQAIRDQLARYWRGIDRRDPALVRDTYHPGAWDDHGYFRGAVEGFLETLPAAVWPSFETTQHFAGQIGLDWLAPDVCRAESYAEAHHVRTEPDGTKSDRVYGLRYVDRFERRGGEWRIAHRVCTWDWARIDAYAGIPLPTTYRRGARLADDPVATHPRRDGRRVGERDLIAKQACLEVLARYARGVDRCDPELVRSTYHPDAFDDHGGYQGDAGGFVAWVKPTVMDAFACTMHKLGNCLVEIADDGEHAFAETYAIAHHVAGQDAGATDLIMGVRYLDRLERRRGAWRIADRRMTFEWERGLGVGAQAELDGYRRGHRDGSDPVLGRVAVQVPTTIGEVADRAAIRDALVRYCRGVDRRDRELVRSAYHPDARDDHGAFVGDLEGFLDFVEGEVHGRFRITMHKLGQVLIELDPSGDVAYCESYAIGHHVRSEGGRDVDDRVMGLRYDDRFERRDGEWRIADRVVRYEWLRVDACDALDGEWTLGTVDAQDSSWSG